MSMITECRSCGSTDLTPILSLGLQYPSNFIELNSIPDKKEKIPLELIFCEKKYCGLLQLKHTASRESLYKEYWFRSGLNEKMVDALKDITKSVEKRISLSENDIVLDIGCNDGTLLRSYQSKVRLVGFEPASNLVNEASKDTDLIINNFFSFFEFVQHFPNERIKVITSVAMFYDLEDPNSFVSDIVNCLDQDGIWVIQMAYLIPMLELNAFDNIVHEHLEYWSLKSVKRLLEEYGLEIFDVELNDVYGGSFRIFVKTKKNGKINIQNSVDEFLKKEDEFGLEKKETYLDFANRVNSLKNKLNDFIKEEISNGKSIYAYGASTKGNTLLQFYNLNNKLISKAADRDSKKFGKMTIGSNIPIISEEQARDEKPDYFLVLPWHLVDFFKERENAFLKNGGKFIVPLPDFKIIS
jgi:SAM-dependent methyltransferase